MIGGRREVQESIEEAAKNIEEHCNNPEDLKALTQQCIDNPEAFVKYMLFNMKQMQTTLMEIIDTVNHINEHQQIHCHNLETVCNHLGLENENEDDVPQPPKTH